MKLISFFSSRSSQGNSVERCDLVIQYLQTRFLGRVLVSLIEVLMSSEVVEKKAKVDILACWRCASSKPFPDDSSVYYLVRRLTEKNKYQEDVRAGKENPVWISRENHLKIRHQYLHISPSHIVTIYSDEILRDDVALEVPLQIKHVSALPIIPSSLASVSCASLGLGGMLEKLNEILRTSYTLDTLGLLPHLEACIQRHYDVGMAFGRLRVHWYSTFVDLQARLDVLEERDWRAREEALDKVKNRIVLPQIRPRRVWDLYSNRVLPTWAILPDLSLGVCMDETLIWGVSHSWVAEDMRHNVRTPINGGEWPVPLPQDITLERVRVELLNLGAEYVWLDVLCLRQADEGAPDSPQEVLRKEEWKLDVPTIGAIYQTGQNIVTYFSGLGRPFHLGDLDCERHWLNRAWTVQEAERSTIIAGLTDKSPFPPPHGEKERVHQAHKRIPRVGTYACSATNEIDKIAGLSYLLQSNMLPAYVYSSQSCAIEDAWYRLVQTMHGKYRGQMLFLYPAPGNGRYMWLPSWQQITSEELSTRKFSEARMLTAVDYDEGTQSYKYRGYYLDNCIIEGLTEPNSRGRCRHGRLKLRDAPSAEPFTVIAHHQQAIPEDQGYVVVASVAALDLMMGMFGEIYCVVGLFDADQGTVEKVSVLELKLDGSAGDDALEKLMTHAHAGELIVDRRVLVTPRGVTDTERRPRICRPHVAISSSTGRGPAVGIVFNSLMEMDGLALMCARKQAPRRQSASANPRVISLDPEKWAVRRYALTVLCAARPRRTSCSTTRPYSEDGKDIFCGRMPTETQVLAFDIYGTLLDPGAIAAKIVDLHPALNAARADELCVTWRKHQLEYTFRLNSMGIYEPFDAVTKRALQHTIAEHGDQYLENDIDRIMEAYNELQPFQGVREALKAISEVPNVKRFVFSNGTLPMVTPALKAAGLISLVDGIFVVDSVKAYKPAKKVYEGLVEYAGQIAGTSITPDRVWLVSGNPFDITGARHAGLNAIWINRSLSQGWIDRAVDLKPSKIVHGLDGVIQVLSELP
ncbi:hypothetical protein NM688_g2615 [Phlebia brevispora]|uniref:Uncharacterized protein n=1 Tax=Phlebia brevispora TaxID=194682 RepID=A0ACC1T8A4_9APHY|nr:hypothetical protein NM688_g2615 [Phlebia brevispora]